MSIANTDKFPLIKTKEAIGDRVREMASELDRRFSMKEVTAVPVLNGAFIFAADLLRNTLKVDFMVKPIRVESYIGDRPGQDVLIDLGALSKQAVEGRHVLIIEDIFDTGRTMETVIGVLLAFRPASITATVLLHKISKTPLPREIPQARRGFPLEGDPFVVGYGIDYRGKYRSLPNLRALPEEFRG